MADIKLTKNELRMQQTRLGQLQRYLPTLQLKKALLQVEVQNAKAGIDALKKNAKEALQHVEDYARLFPEMDFPSIEQALEIDEIKKSYENIAGVEIPIFESVSFHPLKYHLFDSPTWMEGAIEGVHRLIEAECHLKIENEKLRLLQNELREVSIRVNLFEKVLMPRAVINIKKIKVFLGDQQLAAVAQAKVAKTKIEAKKVKKCA
ncbi:MAG: V-type ATP synthase subunit D [Chlamydiae bacterium]|nr:V-type ATP synthase subunit D [Chlamydiota bacterium]